MNHLITSRAGDELKLLYQDLSQHHPGQAPGLDRVRRTALGMSFPAEDGRSSYGYVCVVAERCYWSRDPVKPPERQYVVLDEAGSSSFYGLSDDVVALKDQYLSDFVSCPASPVSSVEALRRMEGLTHYPEDPPQLLRQRWKTFISRNTVAAIRETSLPDGADIHTDLNTMWDKELQHPDDGLPVFGSAATAPLKALYVLGSSRESNFTTTLAAQGIRTRDETVLSALWLAVRGLESTLWSGMSSTEDPRERLRPFEEASDPRNVSGY